MKVTFARTTQYIGRSKALTFASILAMSIMFLVTGLFVMVGWTSRVVLDHYENKAQVIAFFKDEATEEQIMAIKNDLESTNLTELVTYTSKEEALSLYVERFNEDPRLLESIAKNILPASLDIQAKDITQFSALAERLTKEPLIEKVDYNEDIINKLRTLTHGLRIGVIFLTGALVFSTIFVVLITLALVILTRKDEIEIMRLVGATKWQIRFPFILMGSLMGGLAGLISGIILGLSLPNLMPMVGQTLMFGEDVASLFNFHVFLALFLGLIIVGKILGALGAYMAASVYLKRP